MKTTIALALTLLAPVALAQRATISQAYQLTHSAKYDPAPSPDGRKLVYIEVVQGREQLFIMDVDGRNAAQVTRGDADHEDPNWSPDGKKIAFIEIRGEAAIVAIMNVDGTQVERLTPAGVRAIHPNWSPDGSKLAYCTYVEPPAPAKPFADILAVDMKTRRIETLVTGGINTYPTWAPDGRKLAFRRELPDGNSEVFVSNVDGTDARNITNDAAFDGWPAWSTDGAQIAFASNRNSAYQIFLMKPDGSDVRLLANTDGRGTAPQWGRDGMRIYFPICRNVDFGFDCQVYAARTQGYER